MKKQEVIDLASRRGLCVYEQYKGRKVYYKVRIPVFEDEKEIPTSYRDEKAETGQQSPRQCPDGNRHSDDGKPKDIVQRYRGKHGSGRTC